LSCHVRGKHSREKKKNTVRKKRKNKSCSVRKRGAEEIRVGGIFALKPVVGQGGHEKYWRTKQKSPRGGKVAKKAFSEKIWKVTWGEQTIKKELCGVNEPTRGKRKIPFLEPGNGKKEGKGWKR